jgi:two-component system sensor histidine kinase HydH
MQDRKVSMGRRFWIAVPPWIIIGAVVILAPLFVVMTIQSVDKQKEFTTRLLIERGDALIRSFEAGARTGSGMRWGPFQLQKLLIETAQQPGIDYFIVTDRRGVILADSDPSMVTESHGTDLDLANVPEKQVAWRQVRNTEGADTFEVYRFLLPPVSGLGSGWVVFVGLDMGPVIKAREEDARHSIFMTLTFLLIGFAGIVSLFLAQSYRSARTSLSRMKAFSDSLVENMPMGLVALDQKERVIAFNQTAESILKLTAGDVQGKKAEEVLPETCGELLRDLETGSGILQKEVECVIEKGDIVPLEVVAASLQDSEEGFLGYVFLLRDMTEIRHLKREIERSQRLASLGSLAAGVAHEIRNPLSSIKGFATYFRERYRENQEERKTADIMVQEVERLNRVIGQLLEYSRPLDIRRESRALEPLVLHALKVIEGQARERGIAVKTDLAHPVAEALVDPDKLEQVLLNLYLNAIGAMEKGGVLSVALHGHPGRRVRIEVSDTGTGIRKEDLPRIFDPYFTTKPSGTGLGLAIVHKIVEAHDGEIRVESEPGKGTTVSVILPALEKNDLERGRKA